MKGDKQIGHVLLGREEKRRSIIRDVDIDHMIRYHQKDILEDDIERGSHQLHLMHVRKEIRCEFRNNSLRIETRNPPRSGAIKVVVFWHPR